MIMLDRVVPKPQVSMIILTWNQRDLTLDCLASIFALDYPLKQLEVVVVDNGSSDGTARAIRESYPAVTVVENGENLGFAEGNNVGIRCALQGNAEYVMLLNNDTVVDPQMLSCLLAVMETESGVGIVGPKMLYYDQPNVIWCAGNQINWHTGRTNRLHAERVDNGLDGSPQEVDFITACGACFRRKVIEQIGLLDSRFFIYYEETDWCHRARKAGWRILLVPSARLWHRVSAAMGTKTPATEYYMSRNVLLFLAKHRRGLPRLQSLLWAAGRSVLAAAAYSVKPHGGRRLPHRNARLLALRDAVQGRWGEMGSDVAAICYPDGS